MNPFSRKAKLANEMAHQQSYSAEPYREGMDYTDEAWAYGLRALPGSLANQLQALGEYTTGKDYPNYAGNYLNELTQVNEMGYTPQTEYEAGVAFLPELVYDPAIIAGAPYAAYKAAKNAPRLANLIADEAGRTSMRNQLGMLAGPNAKNADLGMLAKAQEMKAQGVPTDDIYSETKWWLDHPDGVPRFEIDDSGSFADFRQAVADEGMKLGDARPLDFMLGHKAAYQAYPDTQNIDVRLMRDTDNFAISPRSGKFGEFISAPQNATDPDFHSGSLHELQHAIQSREGMARGGSPDEFVRYKYAIYQESKIKPLLQAYEEAEINAMRRPTKRNIAEKERLEKEYFAELAKQTELMEQIKGREPYDAYQTLAGEADARLVQNRMNMSMDERLANPFYQGYDVPAEDMIIRFDD